VLVAETKTLTLFGLAKYDYGQPKVPKEPTMVKCTADGLNMTIEVANLREGPTPAPLLANSKATSRLLRLRDSVL
jgi:hypothetical protein